VMRERGGTWSVGWYAPDGEFYRDPVTVARVERVAAIQQRVAERRRRRGVWLRPGKRAGRPGEGGGGS
jgi:hypothetical protein